jgi:hypothetical protein
MDFLGRKLMKMGTPGEARIYKLELFNKSFSACRQGGAELSRQR